MEYIGWIDGTTYDTADTPQSTFRLRAGICNEQAETEQADDRTGPADTARTAEPRTAGARMVDTSSPAHQSSGKGVGV